jgi:hypothetical protein
MIMDAVSDESASSCSSRLSVSGDIASRILLFSADEEEQRQGKRMRGSPSNRSDEIKIYYGAPSDPLSVKGSGSMH